MSRAIFFLLLISLLACSGDRRPDDLIPKEKMASILIDIHITEAIIEEKRLPKDSTYSLYLAMENEILNRYGVDTAEFIRSYEFYSQNIQDLDEIYEWVIDTLNQEQAEMRATRK